MQWLIDLMQILGVIPPLPLLIIASLLAWLGWLFRGLPAAIMSKKQGTIIAEHEQPYHGQERRNCDVHTVRMEHAEKAIAKEEELRREGQTVLFDKISDLNDGFGELRRDFENHKNDMNRTVGRLEATVGGLADTIGTFFRNGGQILPPNHESKG